MIEPFLHLIQSVLLPLGVWGVFSASLLEEVIAPIPSALVQMLSGFVFLKGVFSTALILKLVFFVVIPAALGVTIGSLFVYGLAYAFGKPLLVKWGRWLGLAWDDVERLQQKFDTGKVDEIALLFLRMIPAIPSVAISAFYGLVRFNIKKYFAFTFLGTCVRATVLALIGWQVGALYIKYAELVSSVEKFIWAGIVIAAATFIFYNIRRKRRAARGVQDVSRGL